MNKVEKPIIKENVKNNTYTQIKFKIDKTKFENYEINSEILSKMVYDVKFTLNTIKNIKLTYNG